MHPKAARSNKVEVRGTRPSAGRSYPKLEWVDYEIDSPVNLMRFMRQLIKDGYTSRLGPRQVGALNAAVKNMMDVYGMGDYRLVEMEQRIAKLEQAPGVGNSAKPHRTAARSPASGEAEVN